MDRIRASDSERERVVTILREAAIAGRLTVEELDARCESAYASVTRGELADLLEGSARRRTDEVAIDPTSSAQRRLNGAVGAPVAGAVAVAGW